MGDMAASADSHTQCTWPGEAFSSCSAEETGFLASRRAAALLPGGTIISSAVVKQECKVVVSGFSPSSGALRFILLWGGFGMRRLDDWKRSRSKVSWPKNVLLRDGRLNRLDSYSWHGVSWALPLCCQAAELVQIFVMWWVTVRGHVVFLLRDDSQCVYVSIIQRS